ncbi:MAG: hypothetical protein KGO93_08760 [Cyanobacteria bacterium REEB446]|nr:hypothetical protein [Cyanobacteria bacterium REEB446]
MSINGLVNSGQGLISGFNAVSSGNFNFMDFVEGAILGGFASEDRFQSSEDLSKTMGKRSSQDLGKQLGTIAWDTAAMFVPAPLRRLFAVGNVIEAGREALNGNWLDAGQNLLTAGMQFAGVRDLKEAGTKIMAANPTLTNAVKELADDIPRNLQLQSNFKAAPAKLVPGETPMVLQTKRQIAEQIKENTIKNNMNVNILTQELKNEASNLTANAAQKTGSWWQHVSSNFNAGRNPVANSSKIIIPNQPVPNPSAHIIIAHS